MTARADELGRLGARFELPRAVIRQLSTLLDLVERDPAAPTSATAREAALDVHVADSLAGLDLMAVRGATQIADVGSGAGFPGLVLAAALPGAHVHLVESSRRKCRFLARAVTEAAIPNAGVVCARVEEWSEGRDTCDLVTARAVGALAVILEYAAPLLALGGSLVAWKGRRDASEERDAAAAAEILGLALEEVLSVRPYAGSRDRHLHVFRKSAPTPARFPRRAGVARKRSLRARSEEIG
jgi:16S rRNA (guanine527-N7)-methyltransferase